MNRRDFLATCAAAASLRNGAGRDALELVYLYEIWNFRTQQYDRHIIPASMLNADRGSWPVHRVWPA